MYFKKHNKIRKSITIAQIFFALGTIGATKAASTHVDPTNTSYDSIQTNFSNKAHKDEDEVCSVSSNDISSLDSDEKKPQDEILPKDEIAHLVGIMKHFQNNTPQDYINRLKEICTKNFPEYETYFYYVMLMFKIKKEFNGSLPSEKIDAAIRYAINAKSNRIDIINYLIDLSRNYTIDSFKIAKRVLVLLEDYNAPKKYIVSYIILALKNPIIMMNKVDERRKYVECFLEKLLCNTEPLDANMQYEAFISLANAISIPDYKKRYHYAFKAHKLATACGDAGKIEKSLALLNNALSSLQKKNLLELEPRDRSPINSLMYDYPY